MRLKWEECALGVGLLQPKCDWLGLVRIQVSRGLMIDLMREFKNANVTTMTGEVGERFMESASEVAGELLGNE